MVVPEVARTRGGGRWAGRHRLGGRSRIGGGGREPGGGRVGKAGAGSGNDAVQDHRVQPAHPRPAREAWIAARAGRPMPGHAARDSAGSARARTRHRTEHGPTPWARARTRRGTECGPAPWARAWRGVETDPAPARTRPRHRTQPARRCQGCPAGQCPVCSDGLAFCHSRQGDISAGGGE